MKKDKKAETFTVVITLLEDGGLNIGGTYLDEANAIGNPQASVFVAGALEIAKQSLIAGRWKMLDAMASKTDEK